MSDSIPSTSKRIKLTNVGRRPKKPIWRFFEQGEEIDKGHYVATCIACKQSFWPEKIAAIEKHIISNCSKVDHSIREAVVYMVEAREVFNFVSTKHHNNQIENDQTTLNNFYENSDLSNERKDIIDTALIKTFICCGLLWHLIEHPFMIELLKQLWPNYNPPDRKTIADNLLTQEILRISTKLYRLLEDEDNLTLGKNL